MSGVTKHIFEHEIRDIMGMWNKQIKSLIPLLPENYSHNDLVGLLKYYYPHEWQSVEIKYDYYKTKDKYIKRNFGKTRYNMKKPEILLKRVPIYKTIMSKNYQEKHNNSFDQQKTNNEKRKLWEIRKPKIEKINKKIEKALLKTQQMTPDYIDKLIGLYERKSTSQKDKVYILLELKKYYNNKIIQFFFKLNDTELNKQLRFDAFYHLQSFNYQPRLRKQKFMQVHTKNKKRKNYLKNIYPNEKYVIPQNPYELEYRIENAKEQKIKEFDFFISHSSKDSSYVQKLILHENRKGKNVFCDWINDVDYLKRHLLCKATLKVLEKRLEQSRALIFVESNNSNNSIWCQYELNFFSKFNRPIFIISVKDIKNDNFELNLMESKWYINENYKELTLLEGCKIPSKNN